MENNGGAQVSNKVQNPKNGVVIMTYGSATTADHVQEYFEAIYHGKASAELIADFKERYRLVGHSPLIEITLAQAELLQKRLGDENYVVRAGMRHSAPTIEQAIDECIANGATKMIGIVLSPQFSSIIMEGYKTAFMNAVKKHDLSNEMAIVAGPWPTEQHFIELLAKRTKAALAQLQEKYGVTAPVVFTTHSLPESVVAKDPRYLDQLTATINATRAALGSEFATMEWYAAYQSAGHTPEAWLKPDLTDILQKLAAKKDPAVLIVPIQFLADHLEILYDLDIAGREQCEDFGIAYNRIELANTDELFIEALASIARSQ